MHIELFKKQQEAYLKDFIECWKKASLKDDDTFPLDMTEAQWEKQLNFYTKTTQELSK